MENYDEIKDLLKPRREIRASASLRAETEKLLEKNRGKATIRRWIFGLATSVAAVVAAVVFMMPLNMSARELLESALEAMKGENAIEMTVEVRTVPSETFGYICLAGDFVPHRIVSLMDTVPSWRVSNGSRVAVGTGEDIYYWPEGSASGWTGYSSPHGVLGSLDIFLSPQSIIDAELRQCEAQHGATYSVEERDGELLLTVHAAPQGDFENPYLLNTSIPESENVRRYVIDGTTRRLKSASVSIVDGNGAETEVLRLSSIKYGSKAQVLPPPADVMFSNIDDTSGAFAKMSPENVTRKIFEAFARWDIRVLGKVMDPAEVGSYRELYEGAELLETGDAFTSGEYRGVFVPYRVRLRGGEVKEWNIALIRGSGGWLIDGGL